MSTELMEVPLCPANDEHGRCEVQKPGTPEQAFAGVRYQCAKCLSAVLLPSSVLTAALAQPGGDQE